MQAPTKFSEDIVALSDMKVNPGRVVSQVGKTRRPVLLTNRGRAWLFFNHLRLRNSNGRARISPWRCSRTDGSGRGAEYWSLAD